MDSNQWYSFLTSCLDILRNGDSKFDGLKAINEFLTLITLKLVENRIIDEIDDNESFDDKKIAIGNDCKITYLYENYCKKEHMEDVQYALDMFDLIYNHNRIFDIKQKRDANLNVLSETRTRNNKKDSIILRFNKYTDKLSNITMNVNDVHTVTSFTKQHCEDVRKLIMKIHEQMANINMSKLDYDAFGEAYEKMLANELGNGSKRYGQYFTRRDLIDLIIKELNVKPTDVCYDPSCGTGGFILGFAKQHKTNKKFIEKNIWGQEFLLEVYKTLSFNMLAFNMDSCLQNLKWGDSIKDDWHTRVKGKFDKIGGNPPFGMSIICNNKEYPVIVKDSVALFLQHCYFALKDGGTAGLVIDRGILNNGTDGKNSWEKRLRKFLIENTAITKIINLPTGIFKHTNFATSVIFFTKGTPTTSIKYIEGYFKDEDKGRGEKKMYLGEEKILKIDDIKNKNYSLNYDDYFREKEDKKNQKGWLKLGNMVNITSGKAINKENRTGKKYPYFASNGIIGYIDEYTHENKNYVICAQDGTIGSTHYYTGEIWASNHVWVLNSSKLNYKYLYYLMKLFVNYKEITTGNAIPKLTKHNIENILIPNLSLTHQEEIVKLLDEIYKTYSIDDTIKYLKDIPIFNLLIQRKYEDFKDIVEMQENLKFLIKEKELIEKKKNMQVKGIFNCYLDQSKYTKLNKLCNLDRGRVIATKDLIEGEYPVIGGGREPMGKHNKFNRDENTILVSGSGSYAGYLSKYDKKVWASDCFSIIPKDKKINNKYLWLYLKSIQYDFYYAQHGNGQPHVNTNDVKDFDILVPSLDIQDKIVKQIEKLDEKTSHYNLYSDMIQKELDLLTKTIKNICKMKEIVEDEEDSDSDSDIDSNSGSESDDDNNSSNSKSAKKSKSTKSTKLTKSDDNSSSKSNISVGSTTKSKSKVKKSEEEIKVLPFKKSETKKSKKVESESESESELEIKVSKSTKVSKESKESTKSKPSSKSKLDKIKIESDSEPETESVSKKSKSSKTKTKVNIGIESESESESVKSKSKQNKSTKTNKSTKSTDSTKSAKTKSTKSDDSSDLDELERELAK